MFTLSLAFIILIGTKSAAEQVTTEAEISAHIGTTVALPCRVDKQQCGQLHSLKWYKDSNRVYVLSHAGQGRAEGDATERMDVKYDNDSVEALLKISPVEAEDEATYKCEITYLEVHDNCDVVQIVRLKTLKKPSTIRILGNDGVSLKNGTLLDPKEEGEELDLICEAISGKPTPKVKWFNGTTEVTRAVYTATNGADGFGTGTSKLKTTLTKGDLMARFECIVDSDALNEPIVSWVTVDVHVRPTKINLTGGENPVSQSMNVLLNCDVYGARPAATVRWTNGSSLANDSLVETGVEDRRDGTYTTKSSLVFKATHWENSRTFYCFAENEVIEKNGEPELRASVIMDVRHPPVITMTPLNITVNETSVTTVLLKCNYFANPQEPLGIVWSKDGKNMTLNDTSKYVGGTLRDIPLLIHNVTRDDMGEYSCSLRNEVGSETAEESIYLNVQYPPNVEVVMKPSTPVKATDKSNVYLECNLTAGNPPTLLEVGWFLDGKLMKTLPECKYTSFDEKGVGKGNGGPFCGLDPSILSLEKVDATFAGNYTCQGKNDAGWGPESEPEELIVYYAPSPAKLSYTSSLSSHVVKGGSVTLVCTVDSPGRPDNVTYVWSRGAHLMSDVKSSTFVISPVRLETRSNFTCAPVNEGGKGVPATVVIDVKAPPSFIQKLQTYQGVLYNSEYINLTCTVECYPLCSIIWRENGVKIDPENNPRFDIENTLLPPNINKNDFESVNSTLVWNVSAWPRKQLDKTAPHSNYTCESTHNEVGTGVSSSIEIAVDYPPEEVTVYPKTVDVVENKAPDSMRCHGEGRPKVSYLWKNPNNDVVGLKDELNLGVVNRSHSGKYTCEVNNKHGTMSTSVLLNVQYAPECFISAIKKESPPALECRVRANPRKVTFTWKVKEHNETFAVSSNTVEEGENGEEIKDYLYLESSADSSKTYYCYTNNSVGFGIPCTIDVAGALPWWNQEKMIIIIASIVAIIIIVIIICLLIIILCRRKRADTKYNNPLEMEERENPDGHYPLALDQSKWPLQPGVLVHVNKLNHVSISQLSSRVTPFKTTSVTKAGSYLRYRRRRSKVYARLERLKELLGITSGRHHVPDGIKESDSGVVSFKRVNRSIPATRPPGVANSRKRKKPGSAPNNPSSIEDKAKLGGAQPLMGAADPLSDPDKGFYENLPFHGMQNPPNKPISVIAPFNQGNNAQNFSSYVRPPHPLNQQSFSTSFGSLSTRDIVNKTVKRHQSFHGFQSVQTPRANFYPYSPMTGNSNPAFLHSYPSQQFRNIPGILPQNSSNRSMPSIFSQLPPNFRKITGFNTVSGIPFSNNIFHTAQCGIINRNLPPPGLTSLSTSNTFALTSAAKRISGRNESQFDIRRTASGINTPESNANRQTQAIEPAKRRACASRRLATIPEKRFGSLEIRKHKSYSPTFYSMRCKKHMKRRPIVIAVPKKCVSDLGEINRSNTESITEGNEDFQNLTDSIQIYEQNCDTAEDENDDDDVCETPVPAPRGRRQKKSEIIYANVSPALSKCDSIMEESNSSEDAIKNDIETQAQVHASNDADNLNNEADKTPDNCVDVVDGHDENNRNLSRDALTDAAVNTKNAINKTDHSPKLVAVSPKQAPKIAISSHALKNSPTLKVSPNFVKPKTESPKGALSLQIKAKIKASPLQSPADNPNKSILSDTKDNKDEHKANEQFPEIPEMPILNTQTKRTPNITNASSKNAFYTLTTPHFKQLNTVIPPQYSATIPHQKHAKLIPKALFQEQLPKSKSFSSKAKQKKHNFQIPLQKCHSFKFQTAESYFQPIKNIHEENLMRNGYVTDYPESSYRARHHKRDKPKHKTKGPLVLRRPSDYQENVHFQENMQNSVQLQYPQPMLGVGAATNKPNGVVYADLDMPNSNSKKGAFDSNSSKSKSQKSKPKTEYATLKFNDVGQEIDV